MTQQELFDALNAMVPNATNVVGFHGLFEAEWFNPPPVSRIECECHIAAGGFALALQVRSLVERLRNEGLE